MINRTNRQAMYDLLEQHPEWNVVDLASSNAGWKYANVYTDVTDYSEYYKTKYNNEKRFIQCNVENTPFGDKEFDFVIASHILEHVDNPENFCKEMMRIGKRGYIEVPTPLWDNLVDGPHFSKYGHKWWITFDDDINEMVFKPRIHILEEAINPANTTALSPFFEDVMVTRLYWEKEIPFREEELIFTYIAANSNPNRKLDLRNKEIPKFRWKR